MEIGVVIPTKSNFPGLQLLLAQLAMDPVVAHVVIVADGDAAYEAVSALGAHTATVLGVPLGVGIHVMWNVGMAELQGRNCHVAFINDDVSLSDGCMTTIARVLADRPDVGLVTPAWDGATDEAFVFFTGFAGFCMVLAHDLAEEWRFDERMKWWYGDNDVINWVHRVKNRQVGICGIAQCHGNRSQTINTDPPADFYAHIENDARLFQEKWEQ